MLLFFPLSEHLRNKYLFISGVHKAEFGLVRKLWFVYATKIRGAEWCGGNLVGWEVESGVSDRLWGLWQIPNIIAALCSKFICLPLPPSQVSKGPVMCWIAWPTLTTQTPLPSPFSHSCGLSSPDGLHSKCWWYSILKSQDMKTTYEFISR